MNKPFKPNTRETVVLKTNHLVIKKRKKKQEGYDGRIAQIGVATMVMHIYANNLKISLNT